MGQKQVLSRKKSSRSGTVVNINGFRFRIRAHNVGYADRWGRKQWLPHYKYRIIVERLDGPGGKLSFTFHDSHANFMNRKHKLTDEDKIEAFINYLDEALSYLEYGDFEEFTKAFGFSDPREAKQAYLGVKRAYNALRDKLHLTDDDIYDLLNTLIEAENEGNLKGLLVK